MRRMQLEVWTTQTNREVLDSIKAQGGHAVIHSYKDDAEVVPDYVNQPYPEEAYFETPPPGATDQTISSPPAPSTGPPGHPHIDNPPPPHAEPKDVPRQPGGAG